MLLIINLSFASNKGWHIHAFSLEKTGNVSACGLFWVW